MQNPVLLQEAERTVKLTDADDRLADLLKYTASWLIDFNSIRTISGTWWLANTTVGGWYMWGIVKRDFYPSYQVRYSFRGGIRPRTKFFNRMWLTKYKIIARMMSVQETTYSDLIVQLGLELFGFNLSFLWALLYKINMLYTKYCTAWQVQSHWICNCFSLIFNHPEKLKKDYKRPADYHI